MVGVDSVSQKVLATLSDPSEQGLTSALKELGRYLEAEAAEFWTLHASDRKLKLAGSWGTRGAQRYLRASRSIAFGANEGLAAEALSLKRPVLIDDVTASKSFIRRELALDAGFTSALVFPVIHEVPLATALFFGRRPFTPEQVAAVEPLVMLLAYKGALRHAGATMAAQAACSSILFESKSLPEAMPKLLAALCGTLDGQAAILWWSRGASADCLCYYEAPTVSFSGLRNRSWRSGLEARRAAEQHGLYVFAEIPIVIGERQLGVIDIYKARSEAPNPDVAESLVALGIQIGHWVETLNSQERAGATREFLASLLDSAADPIFVKDRSGRFLQVNEAFCRLAGRKREEIIGRTAYDIMAAEEADPCALAAEAAFDTGREQVVETPAPGGAGRVQTKLKVFVGPDGRLALVGMVRDITAVRELTARLETLTESFLRLGTDSSENIAKLTALCREVVGAVEACYCRLEGDGLSPAFTCGEGSIDPGLCRRAAAEEPGPTVVSTGEEGRRKTVVSQPVRSAGKLVGVLALALDGERELTDCDQRFLGILAGAIGVEEDRRLKQKALEASEEQVRQMQKMEAIGRLAGGVAHDFNNMLTAIMGYSELLALELTAEDPKRSDVNEIRRTCARAAALTGQLLAFSRRTKITPRVLDLNQTVGDMQNMLRRLIGEDVYLIMELAEGLGKVFADSVQIEQIVLNLAVNARDAMPNGGVLVFRTRDVELDEAYARLHLNVQPGAYVALSVSDTGCGMDEETRANIFEPFFTTKPKDKGTGLGLSTVYGIVQQAGGHIQVDSAAGEGTCFTIYLPRAQAEADAPRPAAPAPDSASGHETVLVVDDEDSVRSLVTRILRLNGYKVLTAGSGPEALTLAASRPVLDLVITDVVMPGLNGHDLAKQLAELARPPRVIFMSGYVDKALTAKGVLETDTPYLQKPFKPAELTLLVRRVLDARKS